MTRQATITASHSQDHLVNRNMCGDVSEVQIGIDLTVTLLHGSQQAALDALDRVTADVRAQIEETR